MIQNTIEREVQIDAPLEDVWSIITEAEYVAQWFGDKAEIDLRNGGSLSITFSSHDHTAIGRIESLAPPHLFAFRWHGPDTKVESADQLDETNSTLVEFRLTADGDGTRLNLTESGFAHLAVSEEFAAKRVEENSGGWDAELGDLVEFVSKRAAVR